VLRLAVATGLAVVLLEFFLSALHHHHTHVMLRTLCFMHYMILVLSEGKIVICTYAIDIEARFQITTIIQSYGESEANFSIQHRSVSSSADCASAKFVCQDIHRGFLHRLLENTANRPATLGKVEGETT
jgi:hypothetical protein